MANLKLKDVEIENMMANLVQKDTLINDLKETVAHKENDVKEAQSSKNQMKESLSNYNNKLIGKSILKDARYTLWDQLDLEFTKVKTYLEFVQEYFNVYTMSIKKC